MDFETAPPVKAAILKRAACPRDVFLDGLQKLAEGMTAYEEYLINLC